MDVEISVALNFVISYLYNKLPRRRVDQFGELLEKGLKKKFEGHWYPDKPFKGSGFRCIRVSGSEIDQVIESSIAAAGLDMEEVRGYLPKDLSVWVDPNEVSYRIGEKGRVKIVYSPKRPETVDDFEVKIHRVSEGFNPEAQSFKPIENLSSSLTNLSVSSQSGWGSTSPTQNSQASTGSNQGTSFLNRSHNMSTFTAAAFAATKFGSTKLKTQAKRPSRLSPTEFSAYIKQRSGYHVHSPTNHPTMVGTVHSPTNHPTMVGNAPFYGAPGNGMLPSVIGPQFPARHRSLSPREARNEYLEQHQRLLLLQQQQPQQPQVFPQSPQHQPQQPSLLFGANGLLSPMSGSLCDIYHSAPQSEAVSPVSSGPSSTDMQQSPTKVPSMSSLQGTPSPSEHNTTFIDSLTWGPLPQYGNLQHMLVAN